VAPMNCASLPKMDTARGRAPTRLRLLPSWLINQAAIPANRLVTEGLARAGARRHHYALLTALEEVGPGSQAALSEGSAVDRGDLVATIDELAAQGLVQRTADPSDRRRNVVSITPAGKQKLRKLDRLVARLQEQLLAPLSAEERAQLVRLLTRVVDHHAQERARASAEIAD
jgi:MarR family transcriptional regulator, lower aerobic nicotinate degradation pathway regulator